MKDTGEPPSNVKVLHPGHSRLGPQRLYPYLGTRSRKRHAPRPRDTNTPHNRARAAGHQHRPSPAATCQPSTHPRRVSHSGLQIYVGVVQRTCVCLHAASTRHPSPRARGARTLWLSHTHRGERPLLQHGQRRLEMKARKRRRAVQRTCAPTRERRLELQSEGTNTGVPIRTASASRQRAP